MSYIYYNANPDGKKVRDCVFRALATVFHTTWDAIAVDLSMMQIRHHDLQNADAVWGEYLYLNGFRRGVLPSPCPRCCQNTKNYMVEFGANIAIPTGGTVGEIEVAVTVDGSTIPSSQMIATPAAVEEYQNVSVAKVVDIFRGCCQTVSIRNISSQPILMQNANIVIKG